MNQPKILVSACLLGEPVRYNGADKRCDDAVLQQWIADGRVVPVCPEIAGGLPVPRPPAEVAGGAGGHAVLAGTAQVIDREGNDVSVYFLDGARRALETAQAHGISVAILKEGSPSCGVNYSYDGTFTGARTPHQGVTASLLRQNGVYVFSETQLAEAAALVRELETGSGGL